MDLIFQKGEYINRKVCSDVVEKILKEKDMKIYIQGNEKFSDFNKYLTVKITELIQEYSKKLKDTIGDAYECIKHMFTDIKHIEYYAEKIDKNSISKWVIDEDPEKKRRFAFIINLNVLDTPTSGECHFKNFEYNNVFSCEPGLLIIYPCLWTYVNCQSKILDYNTKYIIKGYVY
jgi:hypothetical protein